MNEPIKAGRPEAKPSAGKRKKAMIAAAASAVVLIAAVVVVMALKWQAARPPSPTANPVIIAKFAATPAFVQMTNEQKEPYVQAMRQNMKALVAAAKDGRLTQEERRQAARNGFRAGTRMEVKQYFALPVGKARIAHLDRLIEEQEQLRRYASEATGSPSPQFGGNPLEMKQFVESLSPGEQVQLAEFANDLFKRRLTHGMPSWPFGNSSR